MVDPRSGYDPKTKTYHTLRPRVTLPPVTHPLSMTDYAFSLIFLSSPASATPFLIDSVSSHVITYPDLIARTKSLSSFLKNSFPSLSRNDVALVLSPPSLDVPVLYFSLLSMGVTVCPINPLATPSELAHMMRVAKPVIAFTVSPLFNKIPALDLPTVLLDSPEFKLMMSSTDQMTSSTDQMTSSGQLTTPSDHLMMSSPVVEQSDRAAILFSSGTTGQVKGVDITHSNFIALLAGFYHVRGKGDHVDAVTLFTLPLFHVFGFFMLLRATAVGETLVVMTERVEFEGMLKAVEKYKVGKLITSTYF